MKTLLTVIVLAATLVGCENLYDNSDMTRIRSQRQVDAYNATVSSEGEKLVCTKERPLGSIIPEFICMTNDQRDRLAIQAREEVEFVGRTQNSGGIGN